MEENRKERDEKNKSLELAISQIERQHGKGAIMRLGADQRIRVEAISTGALNLDAAIGVGGVPRGRVTEIFGPESSGKTTIALQVIANAQRNGGIAAFIDAEHAIDADYSRKLGVQVDNLLVSQPDTGEQALEIAEVLVRSSAVDVVVVDSVAALVPKAEIEGEMGDSHVGLQARLMSQALRKLTAAIARSNTAVIFINQIREKIGVLFGCFPYYARVVLADGSTHPIGRIVNRRLPVEVLSMDPATGEISPRRIVEYYDNGTTNEWLQFEVAVARGSGARKFACTPNHLIFTPKGEKPAGEIQEGDEVLTAVPHYELREDQLQLIFGSILGDGSLRFASRYNACFRVGHGLEQREYCEWKHEMLAPFVNKMMRAGTGIGFDTIPMHQLAWLHGAVYADGGGRTVTDELIHQLGERAIAAWYCDDGSYSGSYERWGHGKAVIYSKSLSGTDKERLAYRCEALGMGRPTVTYRELLFSGERTRQFQEKIAPYVHPSMDYKLHPRLRGRFRWHPDMSDAHLNGTRLKSRATLRPVPMRVLRKYPKPAEPSQRHRYDLQIEGNHTYLVNHVVVHNSPETTPGGRALKFYASLRLDIRRIGAIKEGDETTGNRCRVKVVKNKVAPPFKQAEFDILYGEGISREGLLIDLGVERRVVEKSGAWFSYGEERLGQGRENTRTFLKENPDIAEAIERDLRKALGLVKEPAPAAPGAEGEAADNGGPAAVAAGAGPAPAAGRPAAVRAEGVRPAPARR
jgi:recombination protein RecA